MLVPVCVVGVPDLDGILGGVGTGANGDRVRSPGLRAAVDLVDDTDGDTLLPKREVRHDEAWTVLRPLGPETREMAGRNRGEEGFQKGEGTTGGGSELGEERGREPGGVGEWEGRGRGRGCCSGPSA